MEQIINFLQHEYFIFLCLVGCLAIMVGSFLNVVIWRLPLMLKAEWTYECFAFLQEHKLIEHIPSVPQAKPLSLWRPRSHCPSCQVSLRFYENIPVISYIFLRGRCHHCKEGIPLRYPFIEILCCILSVVTAFYGNVDWQTFFALVFTWALIALTWIDIDHQLLPDTITIPMLWLGLIVNYYGLFIPFESAFFGAIAGYMSLWLVFWGFKLVTGKEGMGYGDFKLTAMLGAWLGWQALPEIVLIASAMGAFVGVSLILNKRIARQQPIPFGPYLALAGWVSLLWGDTLRSWYLSSLA